MYFKVILHDKLQISQFCSFTHTDIKKRNTFAKHTVYVT